MSDHKAIKLAICGGCCMLILVAMLVMHAWPLWTGDAIYIRVQPIDPRDMFRGDYVILSYPISQLSANARSKYSRASDIRPRALKTRPRLPVAIASPDRSPISRLSARCRS